MSKKFAFDGRKISGVTAQRAGEELERIRSLTGKLRPQDVVDASRPEDAALHPAFEWDDTVAGEKYRVHQARNIIRIVRRVEVDDEGKQVTRPAFVHIPTEGDPYYQDTVVAIGQRDEFVLAVDELTKKLSGAQRALDDLMAMAGGHGPDTTALLAIAASALATARETVARIN